MTRRRLLDLLTVKSGETKPISDWTYEGMVLLETDTLEFYQLKGGQWVRFIGSSGSADPTTSVTATTYTVLTSDRVILVDDDTAGANVTVTLPAAATAGSGFSVVIMKTGSTGQVTIDGNGSETINGELTFDLAVQYESVKVVTNGTAWFIIEA